MTDRQIEMIATADLVPYAENARTHDEAQIAQLARSIDEFGWTNPVLVGSGNRIIAGHGRVLAAGMRGDDEVPCIRLDGLTDAQERALIIADNKLALNAGWDDAVLARELAALQELDFAMPVLGFDPDELQRLLNPPAEGEGGGGKPSGPELGGLAREFLIPPFTVLNAREGWWQDRKRQWIGLGIESEVGRGANLLRMSDTLLEPDPEKRATMIAEREADANPGGGGTNRRGRGAGGMMPYGKDGEPRELDKPTTGRKPHAVPGGGGGAYGNGGHRDDPKYGGKGQARAMTTQEWVRETVGEDAGLSASQTGTSIFDPVVCELIYRWFAPKGGKVLDPFAGGSVRGIVAAALGRAYVGIDLRPEQIEANEAQWPRVEARLPAALAEEAGDARPTPVWHAGDSRDVLSAANEDDVIGEGFDLVFSCPPYGDLEVYSDDPNDLSTMPLGDFDDAYRSIIARAVARLATDAFACFVVGDYRDKRGIYANFVSKTIAAFEAAGAPLYNEAILVTAVGSLPIRMAKQFRSTRKMGKTHQNVLVFVKGDPRRAADRLGPVDVSAALEAIEVEAEDGAEADSPPIDGEGQASEGTKYGERITSLGGEV